MRALLLSVVACGTAPPPVTSATVAPKDAAAPPVSDGEKLAAIAKAMNELSLASQQCWAAVAAERFDIEGELAAIIDIGPPNHVSFVRDTTKSGKLAACMQHVLEAYPWAPPLRGQAIQLPFKFSAPDGQSVIDRRLVPFAGQGKISVGVLLDENNSNNPAASMFEVAIAVGGTTGMRIAARAEMWLAIDGEVVVSAPAMAATKLAGATVMYVPAGGARELESANGAHLVVVVTPGGPEGAARAGALPTPELTGVPSAQVRPVIATADKAVHVKNHDIYFETQPMSASISMIAQGTAIPEHVHANETELMFVLAGTGTMVLNGVSLPITETSVVQVPPNTKHGFTATSDARLFQIYTPAGPEERWK
jgi:quercetin dioxygenase-like cupin family protein